MSIFNTGGGAGGGSNIDFSNGGEVVQVPVSSTTKEHKVGGFCGIEPLLTSVKSVSYNSDYMPYPNIWHITGNYFIVSNTQYQYSYSQTSVQFKIGYFNEETSSFEFGEPCTSLDISSSVMYASGYGNYAKDSGAVLVVISNTLAYFIRQGSTSSNIYITKFTLDLGSKTITVGTNKELGQGATYPYLYYAGLLATNKFVVFVRGNDSSLRRILVITNSSGNTYNITQVTVPSSFEVRNDNIYHLTYIDSNTFIVGNTLFYYSSNRWYSKERIFGGNSYDYITCSGKLINSTEKVFICSIEKEYNNKYGSPRVYRYNSTTRTVTEVTTINFPYTISAIIQDTNTTSSYYWGYGTLFESLISLGDNKYLGMMEKGTYNSDSSNMSKKYYLITLEIDSNYNVSVRNVVYTGISMTTGYRGHAFYGANMSIENDYVLFQVSNFFYKKHISELDKYQFIGDGTRNLRGYLGLIVDSDSNNYNVLKFETPISGEQITL